MKTLKEFATNKKPQTYKRILPGKAGHLEKQTQRLNHIQADLKDYDSPELHAAIETLHGHIRKLQAKV